MTVVAFSGDVTVRSIDVCRAQLLDGLATADPLVLIDCQDVAAVDLSFIQLVLAARNSFLAAGRQLALARPAAGPLLDALRRGGFLHGPDDIPSDEENFWITEGATK